MKIRPFAVEEWMNAYETKCAHNLAETCVASLSIGELLHLAGRNSDDLSALLPLKMTYGAIEGSEPLRDAIATLYARQTRDNILVAHGTIGANALVHKAIVEPGDHVIALLPSYQQHYSIPESIGAEVTPLWLREEDGWLPDLDALSDLLRPDTKLVALTNPSNPTGAVMDRAALEAFIARIEPTGAYILCDEVYRGTEQEPEQDTETLGPAMADLYGRGISTAGMSKAFSLAGLRLGWVAGPEDVLHRVMTHRDYDTISVGLLDDHFATLALQSKDVLLARSQQITRANLAVLCDWVATEPHISFVKPRGATICLLKYDMDIPSHDLAVDILSQTGVLMTPGAAFDLEGYLRIGFANHTDVLRTGLEALSGYLRRYD